MMGVAEMQYGPSSPAVHVESGSVGLADGLPAVWARGTLVDIGTLTSSRKVHKKDWQKSGVPFYRAREGRE